jgi:nucleotide-binding universal stress UspA family protein
MEYRLRASQRETLMIEELIVAAAADTPRDLAAARMGAALAAQLGVPWRIVSVVSAPHEAELRDIALAAALRDAGLETPQIDVPVCTDAAGWLTAFARQRPQALPCLATHARSPLGELVRGDIAESLVRALDTPVLLLGPQLPADWPGRVETVLACLDTSALAEAVLPAALNLARQASVALRLVEVLPALPAHLGDEGADSGESWYLRDVAARLQREHGVDAACDVLHSDDPGAAIAAHAAALPAAVIVLGTHGRSGLRQVAAGSVSHAVLRHARCPVLLQRPRVA